MMLAGACPPGLWILSNRYCLWLIKQKRSLEELTVERPECWQEKRELEDEAQGSHFKHKTPGQVPALMSRAPPASLPGACSFAGYTTGRYLLLLLHQPTPAGQRGGEGGQRGGPQLTSLPFRSVWFGCL